MISVTELLAVKLALEEWRHWLEGTDQPFLMGTDHKNLTYIQSTKLFFVGFNFTLMYRPGSWNIKPDSLSRQFISEETGSDPDPILLPTCFIAESLVKHT